MYAPNAIAMILGLGTTALLLAGACRPGPACSPLAAIEADYSARVMAECHGQGYDECPAVPALDADRVAQEKKAGCR